MRGACARPGSVTASRRGSRASSHCVAAATAACRLHALLDDTAHAAVAARWRLDCSSWRVSEVAGGVVEVDSAPTHDDTRDTLSATCAPVFAVRPAHKLRVIIKMLAHCLQPTHSPCGACAPLPRAATSPAPHAHRLADVTFGPTLRAAPPRFQPRTSDARSCIRAVPMYWHTPSASAAISLRGGGRRAHVAASRGPLRAQSQLHRHHCPRQAALTPLATRGGNEGASPWRVPTAGHDAGRSGRGRARRRRAP